MTGACLPGARILDLLVPSIRLIRDGAQMVRLLIAFALLSLSVPHLPAASGIPEFSAGAKRQTAAPFELTIDSIMRGPALVGYPPSGLRWSGDSTHLFFEWRRAGEDRAATHVWSRSRRNVRRLTDPERAIAPPADGEWDAAHRRVLFSDAGDVVLVDTVAGTRRQLTRTAADERTPRWSRRESFVTFRQGNNLFRMPLTGDANASIEQLTNVEPTAAQPTLTDAQTYLRDAEATLLDAVRERRERRDREEAGARARALPRLELRQGERVADIVLSPDDTHVFVVIEDKVTGPRRSDVPAYVTESAYAEMVAGRPHVGEPEDRTRVAVIDLASGKTTAVKETFACGAATSAAAESASCRAVRWATPAFSSDGRFAVAAAVSHDNKDRWLLLLNAESGVATVLDRRHDPAWVEESEVAGGFLPDGDRFWFLSEHDGWMHLYTVDAARPGQPRRQLTKGRFEISAARLSPRGSRFYVVSNEANAGERHLYTLSVDGGTRTRITTATGAHAPAISPDDSMIGDVFSYTTKPPEVYVMPNAPGAEMTQITTSPTPEWQSFKWADPPVFTFKARDGVDIPARMFTPEMMGARRRPGGPAVVVAHGSGYAQSVHRYWSGSRAYMFHNLLAARGYVVLELDYRASAGYGRDWRTAIYGHMGGKDLDDLVDGAKYLVDRQHVDKRRIGVYGTSYGGFLTLMAMFTSPHTFAAGAAVSPVTDWAHYNHSFTSNILDTPQIAADAYRRSSPMYFADGLKGALLICHGMIDRNVQFQDSVRLAQRLIELRKVNWELAAYPVEEHSFVRDTSLADEHRRILKLFDAHLRQAE
jgi:dipeptidyl aminopeptidase/acylaminoacyl peptidase